MQYWTRLNNYLCTKLGAKRIGNNIILSIKPKITIGPHWPGVIVTLCVLFGGTWINLVILYTKHYSIITTSILEMLIFLLCSSTFVFLLLTTCSDPGMIIKNSIYCEYDLIERNNDHNANEDDNHNFTRYDTAYCDVCQIYQYNELNIRHCDDCGCCIVGHDHHCPWMGKCIELLIIAWM